MKLRNKKTGEIADLEHKGLVKSNPRGKLVVWKNDANDFVEYDSLAELNEEWEDYEEPKKNYWYIDGDGETYQMGGIANITKSQMVNIGNYFETREEAEKAVEKLKAWKRLKDKGFRFDGWDENHHCLGIINFSFPNVENSVYDFKQDLDLLFGGEE